MGFPVKRICVLSAVLAVCLTANSALTWNQSPNAITIVPNDYWFNHRIGDVYGHPADDPYHLSQWQFVDDYLNLLRAWSITTGDSSIVIVSSDYGLNLTHPDIGARGIRNYAEVNGAYGIDDDTNGAVDDYYYGMGNGDTQASRGYPPWMTTKAVIEADMLTSSHHGLRGLGQVVAATNNEIGVAGIDWQCKFVPSVLTLVGQELVNWVRYLKFELHKDVRVVSASYWNAFTADQVYQLIDMGVLPITGAGNTNSTNTVNTSLGDSTLIVGAINSRYQRTSSKETGSSYGPNVDCVGYSCDQTTFYNWQYNETVTNPSESWRPSHYVPGATGSTLAAALTDLNNKSGLPIVPYIWWKSENGTDPYDFWSPQREAERAIDYMPNNQSPYGQYDFMKYGYVVSQPLTSGTTPQATGVATLYCAMAKHNNPFNPPSALSLRESILRGCVNVDAYSSTASGGENKCCSDGSQYGCAPDSVNFTWDDDCDGKLGAGRLDAYRTLTLWGRVFRDTTFAGDVYVSGDVLFTNEAVITIKAGTIFHIMPEDITDVDPWQPLLQYDPDGVADGDCRLPGQLAGETNKIEIIAGHCTLKVNYGNINAVKFESYAVAPGSEDWSRLVITDDATVTGFTGQTVIATRSKHGIVGLTANDTNALPSYVDNNVFKVSADSDTISAYNLMKTSSPCRLFYQTRMLSPEVTDWTPTYAGLSDTAWTDIDTLVNRAHIAGDTVGTYESRITLSYNTGDATVTVTPATTETTVVDLTSLYATGINGYAVHDSAFTITGSNFGTKESAAPYIYDNMESGSLSEDWNWTAYAPCRHLAIDTRYPRHTYTSYCGYYNFGLPSSYGWTWSWFVAPADVTATTWYGSYWFMLGPGWTWNDYHNLPVPLDNIKLYRDMPPSVSGNQPGQTFAFNPGSLSSNGTIGLEFDVANNYYQATVSGSPLKSLTIGTWHLLQFERVNGDPGVANGWGRMWLDGQKIIESRNRVTCSTPSDCQTRPNQFGWNDSHNQEGTPLAPPHDYFVDEAYLDTTLCRVELGNFPVYANCTHRELQIPTAWSDNSITINFNQGSFPIGGLAFLFVINADGNPSNGYPVIIGRRFSTRLYKPGDDIEDPE